MNKQRNKPTQHANALFEIAAERIVLTGLIKQGEDLYYDLNTFLGTADFYAIENQILFDAISDLVVNQKNANPSIPAILATISSKNPGAISEYDLAEYLSALAQLSNTKEECIIFAKRIGRFSLARQAVMALQSGITQVSNVTGDESGTEILAKAETPLQVLVNSSLQHGDIVDFRTTIDEFLDDLANAPATALGIMTGFKRLDRAIGGLRFGVHLLGARTKEGKSHVALCVGDNVAAQGIPVLYLDTEMDEKSTLTRRLARLSQIPIDDLESKRFLGSEEDGVKVKGAGQRLKQLPFHYYNISGKSHEEWIGVMRRWLFKTVGFDEKGQAKPCLIILDYIKMMDLGQLGDVQEFQYLGQITTDLHNFARKYHVPIFALVQLNREGLTQSGQGVFAGSDRISWLCSSLMIFRKKEEADLADDPLPNGNKKIVLVGCRFGAGLRDGEYINIRTDFARSTITEANTNLENRLQGNLTVAPAPQPAPRKRGGQNASPSVPAAQIQI